MHCTNSSVEAFTEDLQRPVNRYQLKKVVCQIAKYTVVAQIQHSGAVLQELNLEG